jgi:hypothetical protein
MSTCLKSALAAALVAGATMLAVDPPISSSQNAEATKQSVHATTATSR